MSIMKKEVFRVVDPVLTTLAQGYTNSTMVSDFLFPCVQINSHKGRIPKFNKTAFILRNTNRASGAMSNRINDADFELLDFELIENDVEIPIDYLEEELSESFFKLEQKVMMDLLNILSLGKEKEAAGYAQNGNNYAAGSKTNCSTSLWSNASSKPIQVIKNAADSIRTKIGRMPNTAIIGASVYRALIEHPDVIDRVKFSGVRSVNTKILSELLNIEHIKIGYSQQTTDNKAFTDIWQDNVIIAYVDMNEKKKRSEFNPSFGYTLQQKCYPEIDSYYENGGKIKIIRCTDKYAVMVTCSDAAHLIHNCLTPVG